jgi:hypothetical protein
VYYSDKRLYLDSNAMMTVNMIEIFGLQGTRQYFARGYFSGRTEIKMDLLPGIYIIRYISDNQIFYDRFIICE